MPRLFACAALFAFTLALSAQEPEQQPEKPKLRFTIGKNTTIIEGPLDASGRPDYVAALNERLSKGITPETNANVLLWQAFGPSAAGGLPDEYFKVLGIEKPTLPGNYFISFDTYHRDIGKQPARDKVSEFWDGYQKLSERPWKAADHPDAAEWLKVNAKPLALVHEAVQRPEYFNPLVPKRDDEGLSTGLLAALLPNVQECRKLSDALVKRAMLHLAEGRTDDAWKDLLACHRLGRMVGRGGTLIEYLVGIALENHASNGMVTLLQQAGADAAKIESFVKDLAALPPRVTTAEKIDLGERFMFLDTLMLVDRLGIRYLEGLNGGPGREDFSSVIGNLLLKSVDWDPAMENARKWNDRIVAAMRLPTRAERTAEFTAITNELKELRQSAQPGAMLLLGSNKQRGELVGNILISLLLPAFDRVRDAEDRTDQNHANLQLALALARHKAETGNYPENLAALAPKYLKEVPGDLYSGKDLIYKPTDGGYMLYSVGPNGADDGGRSRDADPPGDDIVIRMPGGK